MRWLIVNSFDFVWSSACYLLLLEHEKRWKFSLVAAFDVFVGLMLVAALQGSITARRFRSAASHCSAPASLVINVNSDFVGGARAALYVINEGTELWHHVPVAGIVEKHTRRHGCERF
jgi:hypothetical protein